MNTAPGRYPNPSLKASDADRDAVVAALSEHFQAGRLTTEELEERTGRALTSRTLGDLAELTADLPGQVRARPAPLDRPRQREHPALAPAAVVLAGVVIVALVFGADGSHHRWDHMWGIWWIIPAALVIARRLAGRDGAFPGSRRS
jgi:Domain of unknown function (DUF1707)